MRLPKLAKPRIPRIPRSTASDIVDLAGLACLDGAAWWWHPIVGLVALGLTLLLIGWVIGE